MKSGFKVSCGGKYPLESIGDAGEVPAIGEGDVPGGCEDGLGAIQLVEGFCNNICPGFEVGVTLEGGRYESDIPIVGTGETGGNRFVGADPGATSLIAVGGKQVGALVDTLDGDDDGPLYPYPATPGTGEDDADTPTVPAVELMPPEVGALVDPL